MSEQASAAILLVGAEAGQAALALALRQAGFDVTHAVTAAEALDLAEQTPDLIILGAALPDDAGPEFCRRIRSRPHTAAVPVLYLGEAAAKRNGDAHGFLLGSAGPQELLAQVRMLLRLARAEAALLASEARLRDILDHAPIVAHVKDLQGRYRFVNRRWETLFHFDRDQVLGRSVHDVHPPETAEALLANDRLVLDAGAPLELEETVVQGGTPHTYLSVKFLLADAAGRPYAVCGLSTDITARKRAEEALKDSEALYHSLVESLPVCLMRKDMHGRFTYANRALCAALKQPLSEILGKTDIDFYPGELARKYQLDDRRVLQTGEVFEDVEEHQDPEGERTYAQVLKAPLYNARGQIVGIQAIYWDITARKKAEAVLGRAAAEFRVARRIQQRLFPRHVPRLPGMDIGAATFGFDISGASYPAEAIGGDYYDFVPLRDGSLGVAIGDVSGHGVGPALLMAEVRAFLRAFAQTETDVGAILGLVNRVLTPDVEDDRFVTLLLARLDPRARTLRYASAGQSPGYILDAAGNVRAVLHSTGTPLGLFEDNAFAAGPEIPLQSGDLILLITDGVADAVDVEGTRFGVQRALSLVRAYRRQSAREIVENLYHAIRAFGRNLPPYDDITATVIKGTGPPPAPHNP
jgi:sigma-B regulation protein RsbU (phosphoserine phosphatase)